MKLRNIILEVQFFSYTAMVQFTHDDDIGAEKLAELVRALPGVTRVSTAGQDKERNRVVFRVKVVSQKTPKEAFRALRRNALAKFPEIKDVVVGFNTVEFKGRF